MGAFLLFRVEKIAYLTREIVQNKPRSVIREGDAI